MTTNTSFRTRWRGVLRDSEQFLKMLPQRLLIEYHRGITWLIIGVFVGLVGYLMVVHFVLDPPNLTVPESDDIKLDVATIDELELWIEERDAERVSPVSGATSDVFVTP